MKKRFRTRAGAMTAICLSLGLGASVHSQTASTQMHSPVANEVHQGAAVATHASGTFEVKVIPQAAKDGVGDPSVSRMSIDKQFHGDLEGTSRGQMLGAMTDVQGSAGYVAMERVSGTLHGRNGTFVLQHSGTMTRGVLQLSVTVVPDSGAGQLVGLAGKMAIIIADGKHSYDFEYTLPETPK